jgi:hypothetical protein
MGDTVLALVAIVPGLLAGGLGNAGDHCPGGGLVSAAGGCFCHEPAVFGHREPCELAERQRSMGDETPCREAATAAQVEAELHQMGFHPLT